MSFMVFLEIEKNILLGITYSQKSRNLLLGITYLEYSEAATGGVL